ncbi:MAG: hypothetical protein JRH20_21150 [Deltaproteobacteria bacterium]|nr:hypothetical protein [Deltaproteobacteria bacterium]
MRHPHLRLSIVLTVFAITGPARADEAQLATFFQKNYLAPQAQKLSTSEKSALEITLAQTGRELTDKTIAGFLKNPVAWEQGKKNSRGLFKTIIRSLPKVAAIPGIEDTLHLASNPNEENFRGYGVEVVAAGALNGYHTREGRKATMTRMGGMIRGVDGRRRESDGAALLGADHKPRLVTVKAVATISAVKGAMKKAADQLALRNEQTDGSRMPGILVAGYEKAEVLEKLKGKDWQMAANRSGAKLLALALNQLTGEVQRLGRYEPNTTAEPPAVVKLYKSHLAREKRQAARQAQGITKPQVHQHPHRLQALRTWMGKMGRRIARNTPFLHKAK